MKNKVIVVIKPKLLTAMTETKKPERYKILSKKRLNASLLSIILVVMMM